MRKKYMIDNLLGEVNLLSNKARFISELLHDTIDLRRKKSLEVTSILKEKSYDTTDSDETYKYLTKLPMDSVTEENVSKLLLEKDKKEVELDNLQKTTETNIWLEELSLLRKKYIIYKEKRHEHNNEDIKKKTTKKGKKKTHN